MPPTSPTDVPIRTRPAPTCRVCGTAGQALYDGLDDRLFSAPGRWRIVRCGAADCGLVWLDPVPVEDDIGRAYETYFTHAEGEAAAPFGAGLRDRVRLAFLARDLGYAVGALPWKARLAAAILRLYPGMRTEMGFSAMWLPATPGGRVLDVGCGRGLLIARLKALGWQAEGVDFDPVAAEVGARNGLTIRVGGLEAQGYASDSFDAVTMSHFIEHVHDPRAVLAEALRILKPGGRLVVATPNADGLAHRIFGSSWLPLDPPRHLHVFTPRAIARLARDAGFARAEVRTMLCDPYGVVAGSIDIRRTGRHDMSLPIGRGGKIAGRIVQLAEALLGSTHGDELMLVAFKASAGAPPA
jgi:2-polyprenyl-3-methyl-5-hydroxy-6-metoxy-1,4-benzoquinol methylase